MIIASYLVSAHSFICVLENGPWISSSSSFFHRYSHITSSDSRGGFGTEDPAPFELLGTSSENMSTGSEGGRERGEEEREEEGEEEKEEEGEEEGEK